MGVPEVRIAEGDFVFHSEWVTARKADIVLAECKELPAVFTMTRSEIEALQEVLTRTLEIMRNL